MYKNRTRYSGRKQLIKGPPIEHPLSYSENLTNLEKRIRHEESIKFVAAINHRVEVIRRSRIRKRKAMYIPPSHSKPVTIKHLSWYCVHNCPLLRLNT